MPTFEKTEEKIAADFGIPRKELKKMRQEKLNLHQHWSYLDRQVVYSEEGLALVLRHFLLAAPVGIPEPKPTIVTLRVWRVWANPRLLQAAFPDDPKGPLVAVQLNDNTKFRPGMTLRARQIGPNLYKMEGRSPRFYGRY